MYTREYEINFFRKVEIGRSTISSVISRLDAISLYPFHIGISNAL